MFLFKRKSFAIIWDEQFVGESIVYRNPLKNLRVTIL